MEKETFQKTLQAFKNAGVEKYMVCIGGDNNRMFNNETSIVVDKGDCVVIFNLCDNVGNLTIDAVYDVAVLDYAFHHSIAGQHSHVILFAMFFQGNHLVISFCQIVYGSNPIRSVVIDGLTIDGGAAELTIRADYQSHLAAYAFAMSGSNVAHQFLHIASFHLQNANFVLER